ncbi:MAG: hypothetical protein DWB56_16630 [Candidatus Jettenia sp.]|nr:MAG: hypothetical protein EDM70_18185 [Candidatus Brocadia sp. AMX2]MBC6930543.1 hypothetical protein [Candidatus Jettenia sp.]
MNTKNTYPKKVFVIFTSTSPNKRFLGCLQQKLIQYVIWLSAWQLLQLNLVIGRERAQKLMQVWSTYIRLQEEFLYLVAILDWYSRYVLLWRLNNSLDVHF